MLALVIVVFVIVFISAHCSLFEATLYSTSTATVEAARDDPRRRRAAERFIGLKKNVAVPIASILILNTISNTGGATIAGMFAREELGSAWLPAFSVALTLAILLFAEIMPKTLGVSHARRFWPFIVWPLIVMNYALYPLAFLSQKFANLFAGSEAKSGVTEDELLALVRVGAREGEITDKESRLVHNIIALENTTVKEIMTPRTVMFSLDASMTIDEAIQASDQKGFTRVPIFEDERENIVGYVTTHDLLSSDTLKNPNAPLKSIMKPISFVPATTDSLTHLTNSIRERRLINVVVDEYGGVAGLITLEDLIETLLGDEIVDESDKAVDLQEIARRRRLQKPSD